jgi:predicted helicase
VHQFLGCNPISVGARAAARGDVLRNFSRLVTEHAEEISAQIVRETGSIGSKGDWEVFISTRESSRPPISAGDIDSFLSASGKEGFRRRIIISTTSHWNAHAEDAIQGQQIPVQRLGLSDIEASPIDLSAFSPSAPDVLAVSERKKVRPHQAKAIEDVLGKFTLHDRGKLIMACGTGKTFTALRLAEQLVGPGGSVLFLVPSISLLSQGLREWSTEAEVPLAALAVCSDRKAAARSKAVNEDISAVDLAMPATTSVSVVEARLVQALRERGAMTVVFATYQSIDVVAQAQRQATLPDFDLIICDEAHRTTGTTLAGEDESAFVRVHNGGYLRGRRQLYMTVTPRIYDDSSKAKAGENADKSMGACPAARLRTALSDPGRAVVTRAVSSGSVTVHHLHLTSGCA